MKTLYWALLGISVFFGLWFVVDHISILVINHGIFSTAIGNFLEPVVGKAIVNWIIWFAILFGWVGFVTSYFLIRKLRSSKANGI